jgi:hypothetical protein
LSSSIQILNNLPATLFQILMGFSAKSLKSIPSRSFMASSIGIYSSSNAYTINRKSRVLHESYCESNCIGSGAGVTKSVGGGQVLLSLLIVESKDVGFGLSWNNNLLSKLSILGIEVRSANFEYSNDCSLA